MSFTFGNTFHIENQLQSIEETLNRIFPERAFALELKQQFIDTWLPPMAMHVDFEHLDGQDIPLDLSDCTVDYEFVSEGQAIFLTTYNDQQAMDKDSEFLEAAKRCNATKIKGLQASVLLDKPTAIIFRNALIKARSSIK